jgi:hypothetical protein
LVAAWNTSGDRVTSREWPLANIGCERGPLSSLLRLISVRPICRRERRDRGKANLADRVTRETIGGTRPTRAGADEPRSTANGSRLSADSSPRTPQGFSVRTRPNRSPERDSRGLTY